MKMKRSHWGVFCFSSCGFANLCESYAKIRTEVAEVRKGFEMEHSVKNAPALRMAAEILFRDCPVAQRKGSPKRLKRTA